MKLVLFCLFNILLSDTLSDWLKLNSNTINSDSYRISFSQKDESMIGGHAYSQIDTSTKIFVLNNQIRYQSRDKIIILAKSEFKLLNKRTSQLFIDVVDENLAMFSSTNLIELLSDNNFIKGCYEIATEDFFNLNLCFNNDGKPELKISSQNMNIELYNIELYNMDSMDVAEYFKIDDKSFSVFDLRKK